MSEQKGNRSGNKSDDFRYWSYFRSIDIKRELSKSLRRKLLSGTAQSQLLRKHSIELRSVECSIYEFRKGTRSIRKQSWRRPASHFWSTSDNGWSASSPLMGNSNNIRKSIFRVYRCPASCWQKSIALAFSCRLGIACHMNTVSSYHHIKHASNYRKVHTLPKLSN